MNIIDERKVEISNKLKKEQANLSLLQERLTKSAQLTEGISSILNNFEQRLSRLEHTILPVYIETETLRTAQTNIEPTLRLLDNVISHFEVSSDVEHIVERGPGEGGTDLQSYMNALERLSKAQKYFEKNIPQSVELINVTSLFLKGSDKLNTEFKTILDKYNTPILPVVLLDLINAEDMSYTGEELDNEQEMDNYLISVMALYRLMQFEQLLMKDIITSAHQPRVFELIVREAMDIIVQDGEVIYL
ncbi:unnamed protein product [Phyllotreta striolata]|uniref:Exocyst complex component 7 n=1 Tax=Phyllotreta striolata TaxID=444603 RepID=A0A9N9XNB1_PHYSR|nr:unnamed protein product [Phyllotreta striolata]